MGRSTILCIYIYTSIYLFICWFMFIYSFIYVILFYSLGTNMYDLISRVCTISWCKIFISWTKFCEDTPWVPITAGTHSSKIQLRHTKPHKTIVKSARLVRFNDQVKVFGFQWKSLQAFLRDAEAQQNFNALVVFSCFHCRHVGPTVAEVRNLKYLYFDAAYWRVLAGVISRTAAKNYIPDSMADLYQPAAIGLRRNAMAFSFRVSKKILQVTSFSPASLRHAILSAFKRPKIVEGKKNSGINLLAENSQGILREGTGESDRVRPKQRVKHQWTSDWVMVATQKKKLCCPMWNCGNWMETGKPGRFHPNINHSSMLRSNSGKVANQEFPRFYFKLKILQAGVFATVVCFSVLNLPPISYSLLLVCLFFLSLRKRNAVRIVWFDGLGWEPTR